MKKLLLALTLIGTPALAGEFALLDSSGTVVTVIMADQAFIDNRTDGPWVKTKPGTAGIGYKFAAMSKIITASDFSAPKASFTVVGSTPVAK